MIKGLRKSDVPGAAWAAVLAAAISLSACADNGGSGGTDTIAAVESEPAEQEPISRIVLSQTAWLSVSEDGAVLTTFLDPNGRYRDLRNGEPAFEGDWSERPDGKLCFTPDAGLGGCWSIGAPGDNGEARATNADGRAILLKRISYAPPMREAQDGSEGTDGEEPQEG